ncbi:alkaline phosphatase family protein [Halovenus rubra]|uniref:Alkaline phosphatase family protein n=2 Tax=Halovenus rubra TaxID=869890 RepID=A0ABD5XDN0_9EURY|nr:alkaline phosphatase family protein [Halovenus rubra]
MTETIVLGLDGATWDIIRPLIESGDLPHIEQVCSTGHTGTLESTFPPITAPAWLSMATGQNPGKTGVFYFLNRKSSDSFDFETLSSEKFRGQSFWDVLSAHDSSVGIFNYPMLYPPYEIDGFMVSGLGSETGDAITYPKSLAGELDNVTGEYQVKVPYADPKYQGRPGELKSDLLDIIEKRETAIEYLLTEKDPDHFFGIISATDWAQHYFWRYVDEDHPQYDPDTDYDDVLTRIWKRVDKAVGTVADLAREENATLLLVSDHGFGPVNKTFHSNEWLEQEGYLKYEKQSVIDQARTKYFPYLRRVGESVVSVVPQLNDFAKSVGESIRKTPGEGIDFERSTAFAPRQNLTAGMIYLLTDEKEDKHEVVNQLRSLTERADGPESVTVHESDEMYHGKNTDLAPDLMVEIDDFKCAVDPRPSTESEIFSTGPPSKARNGGHNRDGIVIASGPPVDTGTGLNASIYDIAPTLLSLHDLPVPTEVDGEVVSEFTSERRDSDNTETASIETLTASGEKTSREDDDAVQERLEDLGYI